MKNKKVPVISIIFYVIALLVFAYAVWATIYSARIVKEAVDLGQLMIAGSEFEVVSYYMTNVSQPYLFALVLFGLGWILQTLKAQKVADSGFEDDLEIIGETLEVITTDEADDFEEVE
jgi:hypothetical protein